MENRYFCIPDLFAENSRHAFQCPPAESPGTAERQELFARMAPDLGYTAAYRALSTYAARTGVDVETVAASVTHLITVSGTGSASPGFDVPLLEKLGLSREVARCFIGYMGCSAGLTAVRQAAAISAGDPSARVLVVSVELNSLHCQPRITRWPP